MKIAVYAGSFDPPTRGHCWMIEEGCKLFDQLYVSVGVNPDKNKTTFTLEERIGMLDVIVERNKNVVVTSFEKMFLVNYAASINAQYLLRGARNTLDDQYERAMMCVNRDINPNVQTVILHPPKDLSEVSSSLVKGLIGPDGWEFIVDRYVPYNVLTKLKEKFNK